MNGGMKETQEGFATLEDVDEGTFVRFLEFLYSGYYTQVRSDSYVKGQLLRMKHVNSRRHPQHSAVAPDNICMNSFDGHGLICIALSST